MFLLHLTLNRYLLKLPVNSNTIEVTYNDTRLVDTLIERVLIIAPTFVS